MFVSQRINPGQAKTGCRLKTKVALHGFAKVAHYYKRSLAHTSMTPNMITRCEKRPTSPSAWGLAKKYTPTRRAQSKSHSRTTPYTISCLDISKKQVRPQRKVVIDTCAWSSDQRPSSGKNRAVKTSSKPRKQTVARQRSV